MSADTILSIRYLKKYFPVKDGMLHAVDDVSLDIQRGTTLGVVGESGCGKSTLGRVIIHLLEPTDGQIFFEGEDVSAPSKARLKELRKDMQMIFQDPFSSIDPRMTVSQLIGEPLLIYKMCPTKEALNRRVREIMDTVGLASRLENTYPHELDGGRRQRIGIGRALALEPKFIICDEPVSALDVSIQAQVLNLMQDLQDELGLTYIFITHDLSVVRHISTEIIVMYLGTVVEKAEAKALMQRRLHPYTKALISAIPRVDLDKREEKVLLQGELVSPINPEPFCRFAPRCRYATEKCRQSVPELREILPGHLVACHRAEELNEPK